MLHRLVDGYLEATNEPSKEMKDFLQGPPLSSEVERLIDQKLAAEFPGIFTRSKR